MRIINIPQPILIVDPITKLPLTSPLGETEIVTFQGFLQKLMHNPMWAESYFLMIAQDAILKATDLAISENRTSIELSEELWKPLKEATEFPRVELIIPGVGIQIRPGFGYHPSITRQLLPMASAIMEAKIE